MTVEDLFKKYKDELKSDLQISRSNIEEYSLKLPGLKHKWVSLLYNYKIKIKKLKKDLNYCINEAIDEYITNNAVSITNRKIVEKAVCENNSEIVKMINLIDDYTLIIDYLSDVHPIFDKATWNVKNVVEMIKLEIS
jgi:hypothetical protein